MSAVLFFPWFRMMCLLCECDLKRCWVAGKQMYLSNFSKIPWFVIGLLCDSLSCYIVTFLGKMKKKNLQVGCWLQTKVYSSYPPLPQAFQSVELLCKVQGLDSVVVLYRQHMGQLLDWLSASVNTWSSYSPQRLQMHIIVMQSGEKWCLNVHKTLPNYMTGAEVCTYKTQ